MTDGLPEQKISPAAERPVSESSELPRAPEAEGPPENAELPAPPEAPRDQRETETPGIATVALKRKPASPVPSPRDPVTARIEKILEDGVGDAYNRLSPIAKQEFKLKGEQTAVKIRELLQSTRVKVKKIFQLILEWLKLLPGINRFFLEQEAKIKTDRIISLRQPPD
ncbi:MAG: hypothetical protein HY983_02495 [Candidatus Magasanikbacteria bacterium]|nr:hypothetical protein [Candidatus Magasanikbacteria bacterium]